MNPANSTSENIVSCPHCGKGHPWDTRNRFRPFCSERCKLIDLGKWADEEYRIEQREHDFAESPAMPVSFETKTLS